MHRRQKQGARITLCATIAIIDALAGDSDGKLI